MVNDKQRLGSGGEFFVMKFLNEQSYNVFEFPQEKHIDLKIRNKHDTIISLQIKTSEILRYGRYQAGLNLPNNKEKFFDFLIFTNLRDIWYIPSQILINRNSSRLFICKKFDVFKGRHDLLEFSGFDIKCFIADYFR